MKHSGHTQCVRNIDYGLEQKHVFLARTIVGFHGKVKVSSVHGQEVNLGLLKSGFIHI